MQRARVDEGFTLIEVIVAIAILMVVMVAILPQLVIGLRGSAMADNLSAAKGVVEGQMERMRNLPWHVAPSAELRIDILDRYYPNLAAPSNTTFSCLTADGQLKAPSTTRTGFVDGTANRCSYEPASGPFYRTVEVVDPDGPAIFTLVTDAQFLTSTAPTAAPSSYAPAVAAIPATYDSTVLGTDTPISNQIGVTVTAFDTRAGRQLKPFTAYTQIADDLRSTQRISAVAVATALQISGVTRDENSVSLSAGQVDLSGFLARSSTAIAQLTGVAARWSTTDPVGLSVGPVSAPPATTQAAVSGAAGDLNNTGRCDFACWSAPSTSVVTSTASSGLPNVASLSAPAQAAVSGGGTSSLTFSNTALADRPTYYRKLATDLALDPTQPIVSVDPGAASISGCGGGGSGSAVGRGYVTSTATNVSACAETATSTVSLFPRPTGGPVLKLTLEKATLSCSVTTSAATRTPTATASYKLRVDVAGVNGNVSKSLTEASSDSELQSLLTTQISSTRTLADYVKTWTLGVPTRSTAVTSTARASEPAVLSLVSKPMRNLQPYTTDTASYTPDDTSGVTVTMGSASCVTVDAR